MFISSEAKLLYISNSYTQSKNSVTNVSITIALHNRSWVILSLTGILLYVVALEQRV